MKKLTLIVLALSTLGILMAGCTPAADAPKEGEAAKTETPKEDGK